MDPSTVHKVLDELEHPIQVSYFGGEPLLWLNRYPEVLERTFRDGHIVKLYSNGLLFHKIPGLIDAFADKRITTQISIDGYGQTYESIRKRGSWDTLVSNLRAILNRRSAAGNVNSVISVAYLLMRRTLADLPRLVEFCAAEGVDFVWLSYAVIQDMMVRAGEISEDESAYRCPAETNEAVGRAKEVARKEGISLFAPDPVGQEEASGGQWTGHQIYLPIPVNSIRPRRTVPGCHRPFIELWIQEDGTIRPCCCGHNGPRIGHVDDGLHAAWNGFRTQQLRRMLVDGVFPADCRCSASVMTAKRPTREEHFIPRLRPKEHGTRISFAAP
jgi:MoaA/NifB/PqqE/SkfB family radical SAM enzyme